MSETKYDYAHIGKPPEAREAIVNGRVLASTARLICQTPPDAATALAFALLLIAVEQGKDRAGGRRLLDLTKELFDGGVYERMRDVYEKSDEG